MADELLSKLKHRPKTKNQTVDIVNYIEELANAHHIAQASRATKDKKQQGKYYKQMKTKPQTKESTANSGSLVDKLNDELYQGVDRRTGEDRRKDSVNRGRYLDSRQKKNRRSHQEIEITI